MVSEETGTGQKPDAGSRDLQIDLFQMARSGCRVVLVDEEALGLPMTEAEILCAIRIALGREPGLVLWRLSAGMTVDKKTGRQWRAGLIPGAADLIGILKMPTEWGCVSHGRFFSLEVKSARGRLSPQQKLWGELVKNMGGFWAVVRSVDEAKAALKRARDGENC